MKKTIQRPNPSNQLSLFDNFTVPNNNGGPSNQQPFRPTEKLKTSPYDSNDNLGKNPDNAGQWQGSNFDDGTGELPSKAAVYNVEGTATGKVPPDDRGGNADGFPEQHELALLPNGNIFGGAGHDDIPSGRIGLERPDGTGRAVNYHNTEPFYRFVSFGKERHLKDNIAALQLLSVLTQEQRPASLDEQTILAKYSGWGGLKEILLDPSAENN